MPYKKVYVVSELPSWGELSCIF